MSDQASKVAAFRELHHSGCFVIPNPWDVGSARILARLGFKALATTSAGAAWAMGLPDGAPTLDQMLEHFTTLAAATDLPLNADFMNGYADDPSGVAANVARAIATGVAGLSIEDSIPGGGLYDDGLAAARVAAARQAIDASGSGVLLTARFEGFLAGSPDLDLALRRIKAYAEAGADVLFVPFLPDLAAVAAVVRAAAPLPVNVIMSGPGFTVRDLAATGVRRVSIGGALARTAYAAFIRAAVGVQDQGRLQPHVPVDPFPNLNAAF